ncbi:MAG: BamA/TamA family outer membrane protein [Phaeodactylibacter sp.]|nr:BamA/TamA family outer membrane protein [Phaeodactylibacter sp.]MCB9272860.1 BamA/TamA family outer membrane protein [Lewinellaceae bacterium]
MISRGYDEKTAKGCFFLLTCFVLLTSAIPCPLSAQQDFAIIDSITVKGNRTTKKAIILREMLFAVGDTVLLEELPERLKRSEMLIMNTGLFNCASIHYKNWKASTNRIHLLTEVDEAWYIYPVPVFELADRNFNVWWVEQGRSLNRLNFGLDFSHLNISGHGDRLKMSAHYGYTRKYALGYRVPFFNRSQTLGFSVDLAFLQNREINYTTFNNKQKFFRDNDTFLYQRFRADLELNFRPRIKSFHDFVAAYRQNRISNVVSSELNPDFFLDGRNLQRYFLLAYRYTYDKRDVRPYPWKGSYFYGAVEKDGLGVFNDRNALTLYAGYGRFMPFGQRWSLSLQGHGKLSVIRNQQPYNDNRAIGFGVQYLHGYEYYIMDGLDMGMLQSALRFRFWGADVNFGKAMPIQAFRNMPIRLHLSLNNDLGYANNPFSVEGNPLDNRPLWGGGLGLDIVLYYDKVIQIEYSFNDLLENGLFLHLNMNI